MKVSSKLDRISKSDPQPFILPGDGSKAPILSYDVPEAISYPGRALIGLRLADDIPEKNPYFRPEYYQTALYLNRRAYPSRDEIARALQTGFFPPAKFPNLLTRTNALAITAPAQVRLQHAIFGPVGVPSPIGGTVGVFPPIIPPAGGNETLAAVGLPLPVRSLLARIEPDVVADRMGAGQRLHIYRNLFGSFAYNFVREPTAARPRLYLVEIYRLSSYLGDYGAGRTIKTFSLLPGESTKITVKSYTRSTTDYSSASSILDSYTEESANSFEKDVHDEESDKRNEQESDEYHIDGELEGGFNIGIASADLKVQAGYKGASNSAREQLTNRVRNATQKHSSEASAKRDVQVNTNYEATTETGYEQTIERQIENINVGRTLNFVFRQMNQEFITIFHLVDVRIGFFNGFGESKIEVPVHELDSLLDEVMVPDAAKKKAVRGAIVTELQNIFDYQDNPQSIIEERNVAGDAGQPPLSYLRVRKDFTMTYKRHPDDPGIQVPGIILDARTYVMRTDGVIVEALLGQGNALDPYSLGLQIEAVRQKKLENDQAELDGSREKLGQKIVADRDADEGKVYREVFYPPCCPPIYTTSWPPPSQAGEQSDKSQVGRVPA
jgi:hypothetical protein